MSERKTNNSPTLSLSDIITIHEGKKRKENSDSDGAWAGFPIEVDVVHTTLSQFATVWGSETTHHFDVGTLRAMI